MIFRRTEVCTRAPSAPARARPYVKYRTLATIISYKFAFGKEKYKKTRYFLIIIFDWMGEARKRIFFLMSGFKTWVVGAVYAA